MIADHYFSSGQILSTGTITVADSVIFQAAESITLLEPFEIENGGILKSIIGCGN